MIEVLLVTLGLFFGTMLIAHIVDTYRVVRLKKIAAGVQTLELRVRLAEAEVKLREGERRP